MKRLHWFLISVLAATLTACPKEIIPNQIGVVGGTVVSENTLVKLELPANAITGNTTIGIVPTSSNLPSEAIMGTNAGFNLTPANLELAKPTKISIAFDPTTLPTGVNQEDLVLAQQDATGKWVELETLIQPTQANTNLQPQAPSSSVYAYIRNFRQICFCIRYTPSIAFTATPDSVVGSSQVTLNWIVDYGVISYLNTTQNIDNGIGAVSTIGSRIVGISSTTTFTLTATRGSKIMTKAVTVTYQPPVANTFTVTATAAANGMVSPATQIVNSGATTTVTVTPNLGFNTSSVTGCGGTLVGTTYTTGAVTANCTVIATFAAQVATTGTTDFAVTGAGVLQASRTSRYRVSGLPAPVNGRPLVIYLHGDGSSNTAVPNAYTPYTDQEAAVLVAPQGLNATWRFRMDGKNNAGTAAEVDDIAFIKEIITRASNATSPLFGAGNKIDPSKVFIIGESRGAGFAYYLYAHPDTKNLIAAIAPVSGTFYCATSNVGNGTQPYNPPSDSDFTCGQNGGFGYFAHKASLYTRTSPPRVFNIHSTNDFESTAAPDLDNEYGRLIIVTKQWAIASDNCGVLLPSANPVFNASINGRIVNAYRQRNAANTAPCAADVTFFIVNEGGHVPGGYAERISKWFFGKYNTQTNTFAP